ncbi:maltose permease [Dactylonectria macrodidyma]|uniref:Maltose permease n=1 Tax=Dactylonectria macrodidyma TaxID=307937 RepID=A0A9P9E5U3_9HYPO|nr:maltose permease [Dactylonectria macrodidyma]
MSWSEQIKSLKTSKHAVLAAFGCSTTPILIGYDLTLIGSIIANKEFVKHFGVYDDNLVAWTLPANRQLIWTVIQFVSAILAAFAAGMLNDYFGRRICFFMTVGLTVAGTIAELLSPNWKIWIVAKLLMGAAMGSMQGNTQTYVSEITPVEVRGFALSLFQFWIIVGQLVASCVLEGTTRIDGPWSWKTAVVTQFAPAAFCLIVFIPFVPESPYFLVSKGRIEEARASISRLRRGEPDVDIDEQVRIMEETLAHERQEKAQESSYLECFQGTNLRRTMLACLPIISQLFFGYPLCGNYLTYFLTLSGVNDAFLITVISVVCSLLAASFAFFLIERLGRRPQLLGGMYGMLVCLLVVSLLGFFGRGLLWNSRCLAAFCIIWALFYFVSVGAVGWTVVGEISSSRLRAKTTAIAAISSSIFNMGWSIAIPYLVNTEEANLGPRAALIFLGFSIPLTIVTFFALPETKAKTFAELDYLFESRTPARKF